MDLKPFDDDALDMLRRDVVKEQERRAKLAQLPDQLAEMARDAVAAGCDRDDLIERVTAALTPQEQAALDA